MFEIIANRACMLNSIFIFVAQYNNIMKKVCLILLLSASYSSINAQYASEQQFTKWTIGARAGGSLLPDFKEQLQNNYNLGFNAGLTGAYKLNKYLSIKTEVNFAQKGKSYSYNETQSLFTSFNQIIGAIIDTSIIGTVQGYVDDGVYSTYKGYHKLGYVEMPLLAEATFYKFKLAAGPYVGLLVKSYTKESLNQNIPLLDLISPAIDSLGFAAFLVQGLIDSSFPGYKETFTSESTNTDKFTQWNYGFLVQLCYQIHQNTFLEARYSKGLNSYLQDNSNNIQLSTFTLSLAYNFGIKKLKNQPQ